MASEVIAERVRVPIRRSATEFYPEDFAVKIIGFYPDTSPLIKPLQPSKSVPTIIHSRYDGDDKYSPDDDENVEFSTALCSFREGSIRASVFNLCSATLGAGALSLPYAFKEATHIFPSILPLIHSHWGAKKTYYHTRYLFCILVVI